LAKNFECKGQPLTIQNREQGAVANKKVAVWSIGIYTGATLAQLAPDQASVNPVLSATDVTDIPAEFVADPFMIPSGDDWYMFFEVMNAKTGKGDIGLATSKNGHQWRYQQIVLSESFHLSYPYVFQVNGEYFMIPESYQADSMRLYRAEQFPFRWSHVKTLLEGPWVDSSIFFFQDRWWIFTNPIAPENQVLELFYADSLFGPWQRHPMSPLIKNNNRWARLGGRIVFVDNKPIRFTQDCYPRYGTRIRAFEVSVLTASDYSERELEYSPILVAGEEFWRQEGMHHIDAHLIDGKWRACVDGWRFESHSTGCRGVGPL
jgi:hypothetical protein